MFFITEFKTGYCLNGDNPSYLLVGTSIARNGLKTGVRKIHKKRDARPLATLLLSTINGAVVAGRICS